ncbi:MAG: dimethylmenaquinone methyltransferase [Cryobacterium sp.]|jgi:regulator of RNase E activity RraA|nr:dimethylmenaquinone methyltransferase [Cryobacterium sp.]
MSFDEPVRGLEPGDVILTAAMVADSLDSVGYRHQVLHEHLSPLVQGSRAFGRASTVQFAPSFADAESPYDDAIAFIDALTPGDLAVVATDGNLSTGYWGELFSAAAKGRSCVGVVTDGNIRDSSKIQPLGFPTFSAGRRPVDFRARMRIVATHQPVKLGGVMIHHGDLVLADDDGIVVIPQEVETEVLDAARSRAKSESTVLGELLGGATLREVWDRYRVL